MHQGRRSPPIFLDLSRRAAGRGRALRLLNFYFKYDRIPLHNDMRRATTLPRPYVRISPGISICYPH